MRVDIVERLTDLIRAALPRTPSANDESDGFIVTNQMTSLTGCSGEHFASILRSLGFVSHQVKKSAYLAASALRAERNAPAPRPSPKRRPNPWPPPRRQRAKRLRRSKP